MLKDPWIQRLTSNEPDRGQAIEELRSLLQRGLSRSLNNRYGQPFQADDILQDALLKILNSLDQFEGRSHFIVWAMTIATRVGISSLRRCYSRDVSLDALASADALSLDAHTTQSQSATTLLERQEVLSVLGELIETELTPKQRLAIRATLESVAVDELAHKLGSQRNAVYKLVHDARMKLKQGLEERGFTAQHVQTVFSEGSRKWR